MENLKVLIPQIMETNSNVHVLVIDDYSEDSTNRLMNQFHTIYQNRTHYICRKSNPSYAESLLEGFKFADENGYSKVIQMDADGSHAVSDLQQLLRSHSNITIGSRYLSGSKVINVPIRRQTISILGNIYISIIWRSLIRDKTNGFRSFDSVAISKLSEFKSNSQGFAIQLEVLNFLSKKQGLTITEVPITFKYRNIGESKFNLGKLLEAFKVATFALSKKNKN